MSVVLDARLREYIRTERDRRVREQLSGLPVARERPRGVCVRCGCAHHEWTLGCRTCSSRHHRKARHGEYYNGKEWYNERRAENLWHGIQRSSNRKD